MHALPDSKGKLNDADGACRDVLGIQNDEVAQRRLMIPAGDDQVAIAFRRVCSARHKAWFPHYLLRTGMPDLGEPPVDIDVQDTPEAVGAGQPAPVSVSVGLGGVAVVATGQLSGDVADDGRQLQLAGLGLGVDLEPDELADRRRSVLRFELGVLGGERPESIRIVEEEVDVDDAVRILEVVADVAPVVVLE